MTQGTILFIVAWVIIMLYATAFTRKRGLHEMQMVATGMGILGTFIGIVWGLMQFDTGNPTQAVPELIGGLQFSFLTSIFGMAMSLFIGIFSDKLGWFPKEDSKSMSEADLLTEILNEIVTMKNDGAGDNSSDILREIKALNRSISGENDSTLMTQLKNLRLEQNDAQKKVVESLDHLAEQNNAADTQIIGHVKALVSTTEQKQDELISAFDQFTKEMAKNNVEALIEAVQKVMEDFTTVINDQLNDTFTKLKDSTVELNVWQKENKVHLEVSKEALQSAEKAMSSAGKSLKDSAESMNSVTQHAESFTKIADDLKGMLETMSQSMNGMQELADTLEGSGAQIKTDMNDITQGAAEEMQKTMNQALSDFGSNLASISSRMAVDFSRIQKMLQVIVSQQNEQ